MYLTHGPKNNLDIFIKAEPATAGVDTTVYICLAFVHIYSMHYSLQYCHKCQTMHITTHLLQPRQALRRIRLFLGQCGGVWL